MVHEHVLIAAYGLCHPDWSSALIHLIKNNEINENLMKNNENQ